MHKFPMLSNVFMLAVWSAIFAHLQNPQRDMDDVMRSKALMFQTSGCA